MKHFFRSLLAFSFILVFLLSFACAKKQVRDETMAAAGSAAQYEETLREEGRLEEADLSTKEFKEVSTDETGLLAVFTDIRFNYDDFSLRPAARATLKGIAEWMLKNTSAQVLIEGHCDERGTNEYNLALGERRANSAKKYLVQLGVAPKRISTISYGEEKPLDPGHTSLAWEKNRRGHFLIR